MLLGWENHAEHGNCHVEPVEKSVSPEALQAANRVFLLVRGMGCPNCAVRVRNSLLSLDGVLAVHISLERGLARILYDSSQVQPDSFPDAVAAAGDGRHHKYTAQILV